MARLRRATTRDLDLLVRHRRGMWEDMAEHAPHVVASGDSAYRRWLAPRLASRRALGWVVESGARAPHASGILWLREVQPRPDAPQRFEPYLMSMFTERDARGRGHATRIVRAAAAFARREGYPRLRLHASSAGRPVYERLGFVRSWEMRLDLTARSARPRGSGRPASRRPSRPRA